MGQLEGAVAPIFSRVNEIDAFALLRGKSSWSKGGPIADDEVVLNDDEGKGHVFHLEAFHNRYDTLALFAYKRPVLTSVVV